MGEKTNSPDPAAGGAQVTEGPATTGGSTVEAPPSPYAGEAERKGWGPESQKIYDNLRSAGYSPKRTFAMTELYDNLRKGGWSPERALNYLEENSGPDPAVR